MAFYRWYLSNAVVSEEQHEKIWKFVENFDNLENIIAFQGNWKNFPKFNSIYNFDDNNDEGDGGDDYDDGDDDDDYDGEEVWGLPTQWDFYKLPAARTPIPG